MLAASEIFPSIIKIALFLLSSFILNVALRPLPLKTSTLPPSCNLSAFIRWFDCRLSSSIDTLFSEKICYRIYGVSYIYYSDWIIRMSDISITLIRHGEAAGSWSENLDPGLSVNGIDQAKSLSLDNTNDYLKDYDFISSPRLRAIETSHF